MLSNKWNMTDNAYYNRGNFLANTVQNCQSFVVPVSCCFKCKQPLKWNTRWYLAKEETTSDCCGRKYDWNDGTLIKLTKVIASSYDEALNKIYGTI